uniref:TEP1-F n=1 Tax=Anopheles minimus TaxID=112268 RepID=A0A182VVA5_9DIPT
ILIVGPKFFRANQEYTVVISNYKPNLGSVNLMLRMEGNTDDGRNVLNLTKLVTVPRNVNQKINLKEFRNFSAGSYTLTIDGPRGFSFHKKVELVLLDKSVSGLIQIKNRMYIPGETVQFRVVASDSELKPPAWIKTIHVKIHNPSGHVIRKWSSAKLNTGVFENDLKIEATPQLGMWKISVLIDEEELVSKTFEVREAVLPSFELEVVPSTVPLAEHNGLTLTIAAYCQLDRIVVEESQNTVYKYRYRVELIKDIPYYHPSRPFNCVLQFRYHDGSPATGITGKVEVMDIGYESTATSDDKGFIKLVLNPSNNIESMYITVSVHGTCLVYAYALITIVFFQFSSLAGFYYYERVDKFKASTNAYIKLELKSPIKLKQLLQFGVTCNNYMTFFVYYVVSKGNIIESSFINPHKQIKYPLRLIATKKMIPKVVWDYLDIEFEELRGNIKHMYVSLAAYDERWLNNRIKPDLLWEDIMGVYNGAIVENEFDKLHVKRNCSVRNFYFYINDVFTLQSMGLFVKTFDGVMFNEPHNMSARDGPLTNNPITEPLSYRTNCQASGTHYITEVVPDTITSWNLQGFSIDPEYGLELLKQPIQITTIQPLYIHNCYHTVLNEFTLFNNLREEYIADVTLYSVNNQTEFIGRPHGDLSYTKSITVPPKVGVPILFPVKARSLGKMTVRVMATIKSIQKTDVLETVIRVTTESLLQITVVPQFFCYDTYTNQTFLSSINKHRKADISSEKIKFRLTNLITSQIGNINEEGCTRNSLRLCHALGSKEDNVMKRIVNISRQISENFDQSVLANAQFRDSDITDVTIIALITMNMQSLSKYLSIYRHNIEKVYDLLASCQHSSGRFDEVSIQPEEKQRIGLRRGISITSFLVKVLAMNEMVNVEHADVIQKALRYISYQVESIDNAYDLSIETYALMINRHAKKDKAFSRLQDMAIFINNGKQRYWNTSYSVETTAYALFSYVLAEKYVDGIPVMRWLLKNSDRSAKSVATFIAEEARVNFAEKLTPWRNDYTVELKYKKATQYFHTNSQHTDTVNFDLPEDTNDLDMIVFGVGSGLLEVIYEYSLNLVNFEHRFWLDLVTRNKTTEHELLLEICVSFIPKMSENRSNTALVEVTFPSGYVVDRNPISEQTTVNPIKNIEVRYGGTSVVVYYDNMGEERNCFTVAAYKRGKVMMIRPAYAVVYDSVIASKCV